MVDNSLQKAFTVALKKKDFNLGPSFSSLTADVRGE
jgi:hypothetical protein